MAIDRNKAASLVRSIRDFGETLLGGIPREARDVIVGSVLGLAYKELDKLVNDTRPPRIFLVGRSGHGKSSLTNALSGKHVAETGHVKPTTRSASVYDIVFKESYSTWSIIDTRGIFEHPGYRAKGKKDRRERLAREIEAHKPDVLIHVIAATEVRNLDADLELLSQTTGSVSDRLKRGIPVLVVITKPDTLGNPREWPPERFPGKAALVRNTLEYLVSDVLGLKGKPIEKNARLRGYETGDEGTIAVIPVCTLQGSLWNVDLLYNFIGRRLPWEARLDYYQATKRKDSLKNISSSLIKRFSSIAGLIGLTPIPVADIFILTPMQLLMIALICGLSCRELSLKTAAEYLSAMGINIGYAVTLRAVCGELVKLVPIAGSIISAAIAASGTYMLGKSAEAYFFANEKKKPESFKKEWKLEEKKIFSIKDASRRK